MAVVPLYLVEMLLSALSASSIATKLERSASPGSVASAGCFAWYGAGVGVGLKGYG